ncbi:MAG: DegV family protein [Clostridia bacterium]|nr:DegV family protein [Clostridia bacterium]
MSKIKIFTDSTSDIPKKIQEEYGIEVLPLAILDGEDEYADGISMTPYEFYDFLESKEKLPSTSRPTPGTFTNVYMKAWKEGYSDFIYVSINSKGSSTYQGAVLEMENFYEDNPEAKNDIKIHIVDSLTYSMGYGFAVMEGAKAIKDGKDVDQVIACIKDWLEHCRIFFVPLNLRYVKKSGRVSAAAAFVGDALGLKPVITFENGESKVISKIRGEKKVTSEIIKMVQETREPNSPYVLATGMNKELGESFVAKVSEAMDKAPDVVFPIGSVIAINSGPDILGVIYKEK